jgi:hypothetical protein
MHVESDANDDSLVIAFKMATLKTCRWSKPCYAPQPILPLSKYRIKWISLRASRANFNQLHLGPANSKLRHTMIPDPHYMMLPKLCL